MSIFNRHYPCRQAIVALQTDNERLQKQNDKLVDKLMSRDFANYKAAEAITDEPNQLTQDEALDPYQDLEDVDPNEVNAD